MPGQSIGSSSSSGGGSSSTSSSSSSTSSFSSGEFGDNSSHWANDGECDDPRFAGSGVASDLQDYNIGRDADDCRSAISAGTVHWINSSGVGASSSSSSNDSGSNDEYATEDEANAYKCQTVQEHMYNGQEAYGHIYDAAAQYLQAQKIPHILNGDSRFYFEDTGYGPVYREEQSCMNTFDGCGADKFWIDVSLFPGRTPEEPAARVTVKSGALDTEMGYIIVGKLNGGMDYEGCSIVAMGGHTWVANFSPGQIQNGMDTTYRFSTSISRLGHERSKGFWSLLPSFEDETIVMRIEDFPPGGHYQAFLDLINQLPVGTFLDPVE